MGTRRTSLTLGLCCAAAVLAAPSGSVHAAPEAQATTGEPAPSRFGWEAGGRFRLRSLMLDDFPVDSAGTRHGQRQRGTLLLRGGGSVHFDELWRARIEVQLLDGQAWGDDSSLGDPAVRRPWTEPDAVDQLRLREVWIQAPVGIGVLRLGRMTSHWGLGLVANSGEQESHLWSDVSHGDVVHRISLVTKPLAKANLGRASEALHLFVGADLVEEDDLTLRADADPPNEEDARIQRPGGDRAWQALGGASWREEDLEGGLYIAHRNLERESGRYLRATAMDVFGRWTSSLGGGRELTLEGEAVFILGETDELDFDGAPEVLDIRQGGAVARAALARKGCGSLGLGGRALLEAGFASGDNHAQDGVLRALRFDPAYKVGMILFEEVLGRVSARGLERVTDPGLTGEPPQGIERSLTNGSVTHTLYLLPSVVGGLWDERLTGELGLLVAFSAGDVIDGFATAQSGGYNRNAWNKSFATGLLGVELLGGLSARVAALDRVEARVGVQAGLLLPGPALGAADGVESLGEVGKLRILGDLRF